MKRITSKHDNNYISYKAYAIDEIVKRFFHYEELEEKLQEVYGECDGLLETVVESLMKYEAAGTGVPDKSRLLTDVDADKWLKWKEADEQGRLLELPCSVGSTVYRVRNNTDACCTCKYCESELFHSYCTNESITNKYGHKYVEEPPLSDIPLCEEHFLEIIELKTTISMIIGHMDDFGKTIFLTRGEAEKELEERKKWAENIQYTQ